MVRIDDYKKYLNKYGTDKIDNSIRIYSSPSFPPKFIREKIGINEEIFEGIPNEYKVEISNTEQVLVKFISKSNSEYRLDLLKEPNNDIWHIGFSEYKNEIDNINDYERQTLKNESIDVVSKIIWILKDLNMNVEYCIGFTTDSRKNNLYEYIMRFVSNWEKKVTNQYDLGWAFYFKI